MLLCFGRRRHTNRPSWSTSIFLLIIPLLFRIKTIASSETRPLTSDKVSTKQENFISTLWDSLKKSLDPIGIEKKDAAHSKRNSNHDHKYSRAATSGRRRLLMEKTLQEHYLKTSHAFSLDEGKLTESIRWKHHVAGNDCYFYSPSIESFWSFKWCPQSSISQGRLNSSMLLDEEISLGTYLDTPPLADALSIFQIHLTKLFPSSEVEIYRSGDFCADANVSRMTAVVTHDETSIFCQAFDGQDDFAISQIHEPKICTYVLHVCKPQVLNSIEKEEKKVPDSYSNKTIEHIRSALRTYLRRTKRQAFEASDPDLTTSLHEGLPPLPQSRVASNRKLIKEMFAHAYDSYMYNAYPSSEIKPMSCRPSVFNLVRIPALTLIDSLDTLIILGNYTEFARSVERLRELNGFMETENSQPGKGGIFALDQNVSVFETNIRILGGLLSAHQLAEAFMRNTVLSSDVWDSTTGAILIGNDTTLDCRSRNDLRNSRDDEYGFIASIPKCTTRPIEEATCDAKSNSYWEYDGFFLRLAKDIGDRLLPAFDTHTGIPYGTVNLLTGIPLDETTIASLAGGGTLSLEMELLSRLTGIAKYGKAAKLAVRALWLRSSKYNTFGKHICTHRGKWTELSSGIGSNSDSFYEYLFKHYVLFPEDHDFWHSAVATYGGVYNESRLGDWYADVDLTRGLSTNGVARRIFEALMAFYPGMQVLLGEILPAARSLNSFFLVREYLGFLPERFDYGNWRVDGGGGSHFLRPELIESAYFLHRATKGMKIKDPPSGSALSSSSSWQWAADYSLRALNRITRSSCGFASLKETAPGTTGTAALDGPTRADLIDDMPSFFLSETLKYLYLTFDEDNVVHDDKDRDWIFTTEAHPIHHVHLSGDQERLVRLEKRKGELIQRLRSRVSGDTERKGTSWDRLGDEKWSSGTPLEAFAHRLHPFVSEQKICTESRSETVKATLTEPILSMDHIYGDLDAFGETQNGLNDAHLKLRRNGNGIGLTKSCPNFYSSELLYVNALNGGGADYANGYVSALRDAVHPGESRFLMLGSIDALAWYGSGIHVAEAFNPASFCAIEYDDKKTSTVTEPGNSEEQHEIVSQRFDGGDLGAFEMQAYANGVGFSIRHLGSGQTLTTTIIQDMIGFQNEKSYFMVDHSISSETEIEDGKTDVALENLETQRSVVLTDTDGNSYVCVVEITVPTSNTGEGHQEQRNVDSTDTTVADAVDMVLARYPCAPGLFGPTHPNSLSTTNGIYVESQLYAPNLGDEAGCKSGSEIFCSADEEDQCIEQPAGRFKKSGVQLVQRGSCTFEEKSKNQAGANAVIVINSEENQLFVMSGNSNLVDSEISDSPLTVLISGADGLDMIKKIESFREEQNLSRDSMSAAAQLHCRVSVVREKTNVKDGGNEFMVTGNQFWPAVIASPDAIQMFVEGGWGVHAAQRIPTSGGEKAIEWQLYLLRHSTGQQDKADFCAAEDAT